MVHHHARHGHIEFPYIVMCIILTALLLSQVNVSTTSVLMSNNPLKIKHNKIIPVEIYNKQAFQDVSVKAKSYVVYDIVGDKIIASKNADEILPIASITKIMTAITAVAHNDVNTLITIKPASLEGGYDLGLKNNQIWKLGELLKYTLTLSSNDGAQEIADGLVGREAFVEQMNTEAVLLGLNTLHFTHPAGLDVNGKIGGEGSAIEVAKLFTVAHRRFPDILDATTKDRITVISGTEKITGIPNTNQGIINLLGAEASKTGFTNNAGGNLGIIVDVTLGHPVVIVVLGSTREERFTDVEILYSALLKSLVI